jgi:hypothetical protein
MGMRIKEGVGFAVLYDSTTDIAFGPLFNGEWEVEEFLDWLEKKNVLDPRQKRDLRGVNDSTIAYFLTQYREERDAT